MKWITSCNVICQQLFEVLLTCMQGGNSIVHLHALSQSSCYGQTIHVCKLRSDRQWCLCHKAVHPDKGVICTLSKIFTQTNRYYQLSQFVKKSDNFKDDEKTQTK